MKKHIDFDNKTILVTGGAGFIGSSLIIRLLKEMSSGTIVNIDNMNDYYEPKLKDYRLELINEASKNSSANYVFIKGNIADNNLLRNTFTNYKPAIVVNLAAQTGSNYSIDHTDIYLESNIIGFYGILQACRFSKSSGHPGVQHLIYASSSTIYDGNTNVPYSTDDKTDNPISLFAATKKTNEILAYSYSKLYNIPTTGLRFFPVYGPAGRPDMFYYSAADKLAQGEKVQIFNHGNYERNFTYIDDVVEGIIKVMQEAPETKNDENGLPIAPHSLYNIGGKNPENLKEFVTTLQEELINARVLPKDYDCESHLEFVDMQPGDIPVTYGDCKATEEDFGFTPKVTIREGLNKFAKWYKEYNISG